jgi:hypothetical protein
LLAVYGWLPTATYTVLIRTPEQGMIPCGTLAELRAHLREQSANG